MKQNCQEMLSKIQAYDFPTYPSEKHLKREGNTGGESRSLLPILGVICRGLGSAGGTQSPFTDQNCQEMLSRIQINVFPAYPSLRGTQTERGNTSGESHCKS